MKKNIGNELKLWLFCAAIGAVSGIVFWLFLLAVKEGTALLWEVIPGDEPSGVYPLIVCSAGGLLIGIFRKIFGDYPEDMMIVLGKVKKTGTYPYRKMLILIVAALLPLIFGSSVGPEAGMVGIITALCCWAGDNLRFAGNRSSMYSRIGASVSLSVMFQSPLFGIFEVEENDETSSDEGVLPKSTKILVYCIAAGAGFGCFYLLNQIFGKVTEGFPTFSNISLGVWDYILFILYLACGILLGVFFEYSEQFFSRISEKLPAVASELITGIVLGGIACLLPVIKFSGEEQMGILIRDYALYAPVAMIGIGLLKVILTNMCIRLGLKGGHFFPLIFGAVCVGYGVALIFFPGDASHATFAAAIVTAGTLGVTMKKPLAVSMLLLLCFPIKSLLWIVPAAALASLAAKYIHVGDMRISFGRPTDAEQSSD